MTHQTWYCTGCDHLFEDDPGPDHQDNCGDWSVVCGTQPIEVYITPVDQARVVSSGPGQGGVFAQDMIIPAPEPPDA